MTDPVIYRESLLYRVNTDGSLLVWVNFEDHLRVVTSRADGNISEAFIRLCSSLEKVHFVCLCVHCWTFKLYQEPMLSECRKTELP